MIYLAIQPRFSIQPMLMMEAEKEIQATLVPYEDDIYTMVLAHDAETEEGMTSVKPRTRCSYCRPAGTRGDDRRKM